MTNSMIATDKELRLHTLRGDIQEVGMTGYNKRGIRHILKKRFVNPDREIAITDAEFEEILDEQYAKVEAWRAARAGKGEN